MDRGAFVRTDAIGVVSVFSGRQWGKQRRMIGEGLRKKGSEGILGFWKKRKGRSTKILNLPGCPDLKKK